MGDRLSAILFVALLGFGALAGWLWLRGANPVAPVVAATDTLAPAAVPAASLTRAVPPLDELSATVQRPLFSRDRRPAIVAASPAPASEPAEEMTASKSALSMELSAVIIEPDRRFALFRQSRSGTMLRAEEGESVDGWTVAEIRGDGVSLERGAEREELVLRTFKAAPRTAPSAAAQRQPPAGAAPNQNVDSQGQLRRPRRPLRGPRRRSIQRQQRAAQP